MTNLIGSGSPWQKHVTRQRVLVGAPLLMCVLVGAGLFATFGLPHWLASSERTRRIAELKVQQQSLLLIAARVKQEQQKLALAQQQQDLVVNLVAGRGEIETFLTQLSRTAAETAVVIERYEPVPDAPVVADSSRQENKKGDAGGEDNAPSDLKGYEKTSVLLQVRGPYVGVLQFLRAMETLELLVQPSDLELKAVPLETNAEGALEGPPLTDLKLRLSFFDKTTDGDPEAKELMESAPQSNVLAPS